MPAFNAIGGAAAKIPLLSGVAYDPHFYCASRYKPQKEGKIRQINGRLVPWIMTGSHNPTAGNRDMSPRHRSTAHGRSFTVPVFVTFVLDYLHVLACSST